MGSGVGDITITDNHVRAGPKEARILKEHRRKLNVQRTLPHRPDEKSRQNAPRTMLTAPLAVSRARHG